MNKLKILVIQLSRYGDIFMTLPFTEKLKKNYYVYLMINENFKDIPGIESYIDELIPVNFNDYYFQFSSDTLQKNIRAFHEFVNRLNNCNIDTILNLSSQPISAVITTIVKARRKFGLYIMFDRSFGESGTNLSFYADMKEAKKYNWIHQSDIFKTSIDEEIYDYNQPINLENLTDADIFSKFNLNFESDEKIIGLQLGASLFKKEYPIEYFERLMRFISAQHKVKYLLLGASNEIAKSLKFSNLSGVINLIGKTDLIELLSILKKIDLLITNDTGTMHFAAAVNARILAIELGSAFFPETVAYKNDVYIIAPVEKCYPCDFPKLACVHLNCKKNIEPETIFNLVEFILYDNKIAFDNILYEKIYKTEFIDNYIFFIPLKKREISEFEYFGCFYNNYWKSFFRKEKLNITAVNNLIKKYYYVSDTFLLQIKNILIDYFDKYKLLAALLENLNENNFQLKIYNFGIYIEEVYKIELEYKFLAPLKKYREIRFHSVDTADKIILGKEYKKVFNEMDILKE